MAIEICDNTAAAEWIVSAHIPATELIGFGPSGFPAYARLRYIPDPAGPDQQEADVVVAEDHPSSIDQARRALGILGDFTSTPDECYFCVWDGRGEIHLPSSVDQIPLVVIPDRKYVLLHGSLADLSNWDAVLGGEDYPHPPSFAWPADHRWCFASDVDPHWAGIGSSEEAIQALIEDPLLDVAASHPAESQPTYY